MTMTPESNQERFETVLRLRRAGLTFTQIGEVIGVNTSRAHVIHGQALAHEEKMQRLAEGPLTADTPIESLKLSDRTYKSLTRAGYKLLGDAMPLDEAKQRELIALPNFGHGQLKELQAIITSL